MKISQTFIKRLPAVLLSAVVVSLSLCSCKGRTDSNMVPNGETVDVVIPEDTTSYSS